MRYKITEITEKFGSYVFSGRLEGGTLLVGDAVEFVRGEDVLGQGLVCGVLVSSKALDEAQAGSEVACPIRSKVSGLVRVGDIVRSAS